MFLEKYLKEFYYNQVIDTYNKEYLDTLDEKNLLEIYQLLVKFNFYFIDDIILKYLEIFEMDFDEVYRKLTKLKEKLGEDYNYIIGNKMTYLEEIINED